MRYSHRLSLLLMLVILALFADETLARKLSSGTAGGTAKTGNVSNNNNNSNNDTTATKTTKNESTSTTTPTTTTANDTNTSDAPSTEAVVTPSPYHAHHNYPQAPVLATNSDNNYYSKNNKNKQQEEDTSNNDQNGNDNGMVSSPSFAPVVHPVVTASTAPTVFQYNDDTGNDNDNNNNSYDDISEEGSENETDDTVLDEEEEESDNTNINNNMDDYSNTDPGAAIVIEGYELEVHVTLANTNMVRSRVLALSANDSVGTLIGNRVEELTYIWLEEYTRDQLALSQYYAPLNDMSLTLVSSSNSDSDNNTLIYSYVPVSNFLNFPLPTKTTLGTLANECFNYGARSEEFEQAVIAAVQNDVNVELESVRVIESSSGMIVEGNGDSDLLTSTGTEYNNDNTEEGVSLGLLTGVAIAGSAMLLLSSFLVLRAQRRRRLKREKREGDVYDDNDEPESLCDQLLYGDLFLDDDESCGGNSLVYDAQMLPVCQGQPLKCKSSSTADSTARSSSSAASTAHSVTSGTTSAMTQSVTNAHQPSSKLYSQSHSYNENDDLMSSPVLEYSMEQNDTSSAASSNSSNSSDDKSFRRFDNAQSKGMENQQGGLLSGLADEEADSTTNYAKSMGWFTARHMTPRK